MKLVSFSALVMILGKERRVDFEESTREGEPGSLTISGLTVDEAKTACADLAHGKTAPAPASAPAKPAEPAKAASAPAKTEPKAAPAKPAAAPAAAPAGKKAEAAKAPAAAPAKAAKAPAAKPAPAPPPPSAKPAELDMPGGEEEEEQEEGEEQEEEEQEEQAEEGSEDAGDEELVAQIPDALKGTGAKMKDVVTFLSDHGYRTKEQLLVGIERIKAEVPMLARMTDIPDRLERTIQVMGYKP